MMCVPEESIPQPENWCMPNRRPVNMPGPSIHLCGRSRRTMEHLAKALNCFFFDKGNKEFVVRGGSMAPLLRDRQKIIVAPLSSPLKHGWCYVFRAGEKLIIHRLVRVKNDRALFVGDHSPKVHDIPVSDIIGRPLIKEKSMTRLIIHAINCIFLQRLGFIPKSFVVRTKLIQITAAFFSKGKA
ncbi:MAG: hypothetical protein GF401_11225 [Chitinivibrionales bacterium]|nr:hypothetical protein [Chitinivibrionales bacterium]